MQDTSSYQSDVAIIGAGPVGLFGIFECGMLGLGCHVIDALDMAGGQCAALYPEKPIYDIPGFPRISAQSLIDHLMEQSAPFEPTYHLGQSVVEMTSIDGGWRLLTSRGTVIHAKAVIIAAGVGAFGPNRPPLDGIEAYEGTSVFYHVSQPEQFRGSRLVIAGGGDTALDWALTLAEVADKIYFVHRRAKFRGAPQSGARLMRLAHESDKVEMVIPYQLHSLAGNQGKLEHIIVSDLEGSTKKLPADYLLPFFGLSMNLGPIAKWGLTLSHNHIVVDPANQQTDQPGIYAIGDIATYPNKLKLILTGFSEAAMAAHAIYRQIHPGESLHWEYSTSKGLPGLSKQVFPK